MILLSTRLGRRPRLQSRQRDGAIETSHGGRKGKASKGAKRKTCGLNLQDATLQNNNPLTSFPGGSGRRGAFPKQKEPLITMEKQNDRKIM
jgi:hypothetical protein